MNYQKPGIKNLKFSKTLESSNVFAYFVCRDCIFCMYILHTSICVYIIL